MTQCMVRPCVARDFSEWGMCGLASMYPAFAWSLCAPGHDGYQRACDLISGQASMGHVGHQCSHAPGRPILHLVILSQTSAGKTFQRLALRSRGLNLGRFEGSPMRMLQAMRESLSRTL
jgi:hypothetical protein